MTDQTRAKITSHLKRYIVEQNYERYTAEDQAAWRFIMRQLTDFLARHGHPSYREGLKQTGLEIDRIPRIEHVDQMLEKLGWGAVPVSGFIPPAAFMEFQSLGILPIASDMRSLEHLQYTPAPDIVHEAAGHAPILINPDYANYLLAYGEIARHAILSRQDLAQYEAIRRLSDLKESPQTSPALLAAAEASLVKISAEMGSPSEAALLSRMNWWTAEYGLIGSLEDPKIFGAGLLSSVGESRVCLDKKVRRLPLSVACVDYAYDITEPQPQLFVCRDFAHLTEVLEEFTPTMSYRRGGIFGLEKAKVAATVNTVRLNSHLQISGVLESYDLAGEAVCFLKFGGPAQLSIDYQQLKDQGREHHPHGFSSPLGQPRGFNRCLSEYSENELAKLGLSAGKSLKLTYPGGIEIEGSIGKLNWADDRLVILTWSTARVLGEGKLLFDPAWGVYDMAVGCEVTSVFGGAADRARYGEGEDFRVEKILPRNFNSAQESRHGEFAKIQELRASFDPMMFSNQLSSFLSSSEGHWLLGLELLELGLKHNLEAERLDELERRLSPDLQLGDIRECLQDGLRLMRGLRS